MAIFPVVPEVCLFETLPVPTALAPPTPPPPPPLEEGALLNEAFLEIPLPLPAADGCGFFTSVLELVRLADAAVGLVMRARKPSPEDEGTLDSGRLNAGAPPVDASDVLEGLAID